MKSKLILVAIGALAIFSSSPAESYSTFGAWSGSPGYYVNLSGANLPNPLAAIQNGINQWNAVGTSVQSEYKGATDKAVNAYDGTNVIFFRTETGTSALATAYTWWSGSTILDGDVRINTAYQFYGAGEPCNGFYLDGAMAHEWGHVLGLNHSGVGSATMYPSVGGCQEDFIPLDPDDIAGLESLYKTGGTTPPPPPPAPLPPPPPAPTPTPSETTPPTVNITAPADGTRVPSKGSFSVNANASDASGISSIKILVDQKVVKTCTAVTTCSVSVNGNKLSAGSHTITAEAVDKAANSAAKSIIIFK